jgi:hypothetical protein
MMYRLIALVTLVTLSFQVFADQFQDDEMIFAASMGLTDYVISLIESGADVNAVDDSGRTAVRLAYESGFGELVGVLFDAGAEISAVLNESSVRIRNEPTTQDSMTIGSLNKGDQVVVLGRSRDEETISSMTAHWYKIRTGNGLVGYSYGYFFDVHSRDLQVLPTFYFNSKYGFNFTFPVTWNEWIAEEKMRIFGFGVAPVPCVYFGLPDQINIFAISVFTPEQWKQLSNMEWPEGVEGNPIAGNSQYLIDYSLGHYAANEEMEKRRREIQNFMRTIEIDNNTHADTN